jgi:phospholipid/cholesterol/gamma-HCH transport system substrate-binding protein
MNESKLELKVGALLLAAIVGSLALLTLMGELHVGSSATLRVNWSHTGNVVKGAPVKIAGVAIGRVEKITLDAARRDPQGEPMPVTMVVALDKDARVALHADTAITISSQGALGEPYLEVYPGVAPQMLPDDAEIRGVDSPRIDVVANRLGRFLEAASKVLENDPEAMTKFVTSVTSLTATADSMLTDNRSDVRQLMGDLTQAVKDLRALSAVAKTQFEPGGKANGLIDDASATMKDLRADVPTMSKQAKVVLGGAAALAGSFTEEDGKKLKEAIGRYSAAGEKLDAIALRADRMLAKLEAGEGTLGATLKDKQVYDDLRALLADLKKHPWKMLWKD